MVTCLSNLITPPNLLVGPRGRSLSKQFLSRIKKGPRTETWDPQKKGKTLKDLDGEVTSEGKRLGRVRWLTYVVGKKEGIKN